MASGLRPPAAAAANASGHGAAPSFDFASVALERGVTHDSDFERWANKVWDYRQSEAVGTPDRASDPAAWGIEPVEPPSEAGSG